MAPHGNRVFKTRFITLINKNKLEETPEHQREREREREREKNRNRKREKIEIGVGGFRLASEHGREPQAACDQVALVRFSSSELFLSL